MNLFMKKLFIINIVFLSALFISCNKDQVQNPVPDIPFDVSLNLTLPLYVNLQVPFGGIVYYNTGSRGIAILRTSNTEFAIFDRHCPYNIEDGCVVEVDEDNIGGLMDSECCNSKFSMINAGLPSQGPAVNGLKPYQYTFNGTILRIFNQ